MSTIIVKEVGDYMEKVTLTEFGKSIKKKLVDIDRSQNWLIEQVANETGLYFDRSYLYKIQTGQLSSPKILAAICKIIEIKE